MNAATEFDLGPLTWVKNEIDLALQRAEEALAQYEASDDLTQLKFCRTHVHQVYGALSIVGLDGVTQVTESLELLLQDVEEGRRPADSAMPSIVQQTLLALRQYLDDLMVGEPNQPLRLLPVYEALTQARGGDRAHPGELFFPDLSLRPPKRSSPAPLPSDELKKTLRNERMRFQRGLLGWLTNPDEAVAGLEKMQAALTAIEAGQSSQAARSFWWVALAYLDALRHPQIASDLMARQLCSRIDAQIRRLLEGSNNVAERVMREALYYIAKAPAEPGSPVAELQAAFSLPSLLPAEMESAAAQPHDAALRKLRELVAAIEEQWSKFCSGSASSLVGFADKARLCAQLTGDLAQTDIKRLGQGLGAVANWLAEDPKRYSDTVAMEVATTILLLQNAQENFKHLGTDFAQQVDLMVARLYACIAGKPVTSEVDIPLLDEMTRRAQERLLLGQVAREIQTNLAQIEQALDAFFRNPSKPHDLAQLDAPVKQVAGALAMLGHFGAVNCLQECGARIQEFAQPDYLPVNEDFESVAQQLSLLGFFVDSLHTGETDFDAFVARLRGDNLAEPVEEDDTLPTPTVEDQLVQQARETQALVEALKVAPQDERLQDELKQNLQSIQKDADLVANKELGDSAKAALQALQSGGEVVLSGIRQGTVEAPEPSAETLQLAESSHEEIDAELLEIFLEEAREVLATMGEQKDFLEADPHNTEALTTIRRSTHTLKGSGRMVGLTDLGEAAWEMEQTYNLWLRQEQPVTAELMRLIGEEHELFSAWVHYLESGDGSAPNPASAIELAARLRGVEIAAPAVQATEPVVQIEVPEPPAVSTGDELLVDLADFDMPDFDAEKAHRQQGIEDVGAVEGEADIQKDAEELLSFSDEDLQFEQEALPDAPSLSSDTVEQSAEPGVPEQLTEEAPVAVDGSTEEEMAPTSPTLYDIFREEARGHLQTLLDSYAALDANPHGPTTFEMTRAAHTLGGIAATVGLMPLNHLAIALEHALLRRDGSAHPESIEGLETVHQAVLTLEEMFVALASQQTPEEQSYLITALGDIYQAPPVVNDEPDVAAVGAEIIPLRANVELPGNLPVLETPQVAEVPALPQLTDELDEQLLPIFLEEAADQLRELTIQLRAWRSEPEGEAAPHAIARLLHTFKGNARMAGAMNLGELTHLLETRIEDALHAGPATPAFIDDIEGGCDALAAYVERLRSGPEAPVAPAEPAVDSVAEQAATGAAVAIHGPEGDADSEVSGQKATLRVRADLVDRLVNEAGELSIARTRIEGEMRSLKGSLLDLTENVIRLRRQLREIEIQAETQIQTRVAQSSDGMAEFDPLELDRFTRFQELTRFMAESVNDVATVQQNLLKNLDDANAAILAQSRLNRSLQQDLMGVRMLPFDSQAERLYRIVRQTAKEVGKRANLDIVGGQVEIDRSVLDKMLAPVEHMLRNAVTHGIESRDVRQAAGKPETGEITLSLAQEGNEIILSMSDDGQGLDAGKIRARAEALGLLGADDYLDEPRLYDFIFQPGFSTASELTQVSGRGVGMDVVKTEVAALGGRIEIISLPGKGTTFRLYLPLTLAVTQTLLVRVGGHLYAVPSTMIEQVLELKEKPLAALREKGEAEWQSHHYPFHFLPHLLGDLEAIPETHRQYWVLLLRSGSQRVAVQVDELKGNQEVVVKNVGAQLARIVGIAGATVLGDGQVVLILNPVALASRALVVSPVAEAAQDKPPEVTEVARPSLPTVMVVDDSLTVRKITSRLLLREGYQVILAKDGVDALEQLSDVIPDVILSDVEMPRMDGFDLVRNIRADDRLRDIPIVMITSRTADKHRNYALEIGANHYLGKPYDEDELLSLVAGYASFVR